MRAICLQSLIDRLFHSIPVSELLIVATMMSISALFVEQQSDWHVDINEVWSNHEAAVSGASSLQTSIRIDHLRMRSDSPVDVLSLDQSRERGRCLVDHKPDLFAAHLLIPDPSHLE